MEHLITDTGIQFIVTEAEFNPSEPLRLPSGKVLRYSFAETVDSNNPGQINFDLLFNHNEEEVWVPVSLLRSQGLISILPNGVEETDETGVPRMPRGTSAAMLPAFGEEDPAIINVNSLESFRVNVSEDSREKVPAFNRLLNQWLPMPMFEYDTTGHTSGLPMGWCRVMISDIGEGSSKGMRRYRFTWAFDTHTAFDNTSSQFPFFDENDPIQSKTYRLCDRPDATFHFMSLTPGNNANAQYVASLLGVQPDKLQVHRYRYIAYYIYLINFIARVGAAPEITLHNPPASSDIAVDFVLDIGNSRTCGVLFEDGDFTRSMMLELRNLSKPWITYSNPFDMRLVFRRPDFGNDLVLPEEAFSWKSIVRVGEEARSLVYRSIEDEGLAERACSYSSPKRYLWDTRNSTAKWEFLVTDDDSFNVRQQRSIFLDNFTDMFDDKGCFQPDADTMTVFDFNSDIDITDCHYSRASLMTFVMIETLTHAITQINSVKYRSKHGKVDCRRRLRNVILTCPTAMPRAEQISLRQSMLDARAVITRCHNNINEFNVIPAPKSLRASDSLDSEVRQWCFDEASACQLVYLYAELAERYNGEIRRFFDTKGHLRSDLAEEGYDRNSLTIASIDIGAGTTDVMICAYKYEDGQNALVTPVPLFYDSFYLAGDDILRNLVQQVVIEGDETNVPDLGNIHSALLARYMKLTDEEFKALPINNSKFTTVYAKKIDDIVLSTSPQQREKNIRYLVSLLIRDFFGQDSAMMSFTDRQARLDFNTQISLPIARRMMDLLRLRRPARTYSYDEIFSDFTPSRHLLDHFERHFGFRFEELSWRFDPEKIAAIIRATMEPLMKQLSILLYAYHSDILILAGRPTTIETIPELFIKYYPLSPDRIIRMNDYRVGTWYPFADGQGHFYDQKSIVAVGAMIGHLASTEGFNGLQLNFNEMIDKMHSTANYIGFYDSATQLIKESILSPEVSNVTANVAVFPTFLGCKQFDTPQYHGRPIYGIYSTHRSSQTLRVNISRSFVEDREELVIEEVTDMMGNTLPKSSVELRRQSIVADGKYWLDKGEFNLSLK